MGCAFAEELLSNDCGRRHSVTGQAAPGACADHCTSAAVGSPRGGFRVALVCEPCDGSVVAQVARLRLTPSFIPGKKGATKVVSVARLREFGRRHRVAVAVVGAVATAALLAAVLARRREEFQAAVSSAPWWVLAVTVALHVIALLSRSEAWHLSVDAAGGSVPRRVLFRASSMQVLGSLLSGQLGAAARIVALRRSSRDVCPQVPTLIAAEVPILSAEVALAALTSFTLVGPLGLAWWLPLAAGAVILAGGAGLRRLALCTVRELWRGLAVLRSLGGGGRVLGWVLVAIFCQIVRNWLLLHAVGVDASFFDAIAVLIAVVTLGQLPVGPAVGAAAAVLILGSNDVAASAAAGVLMTATGTAGALGFAVWAGLDGTWARIRRHAPRTADTTA